MRIHKQAAKRGRRTESRDSPKEAIDVPPILALKRLVRIAHGKVNAFIDAQPGEILDIRSAAFKAVSEDPEILKLDIEIIKAQFVRVAVSDVIVSRSKELPPSKSGDLFPQLHWDQGISFEGNFVKWIYASPAHEQKDYDRWRDILAQTLAVDRYKKTRHDALKYAFNNNAELKTCKQAWDWIVEQNLEIKFG